MAMFFSRKKQAQQSGAMQDPSSPYSHKVTRQGEIANTDQWEKQIMFWRSHIDIFIEDYLSIPDKPIQLFPFQKVLVRATGNCIFITDVESRSLGKTYKMALVLIALAILYADNKILVVSKTVRQAMLVVKYIQALANDNPNISREIVYPIKMQKDFASMKFRSGAELDALAMNIDGSNLRGLRKKVLYIDESAWVNSEVIESVLKPILQYKRDVYWRYKGEFEDFPSKFIQTSSAYLKSCDFFTRFKNALTDMKNGNKNTFACSLSYKTGVRHGIIDEEFVENQRGDMNVASWEMEWNSRFIGETEGAYFPYDLTEPCRVLDKVEYVQAKGSKSRYLLSCDIATSAKTYADNACLSVLKISELANGTFQKYLVYIKTYHGQQLEILSKEIRQVCIRFPNIEKVIIDVNALGEGIVSLLNSPFIDENNKEYPPFILDSFDKTAGNAIPIIRGVRADVKFNCRMATATRMYLENKSLHLPIPSNTMRREIEVDKSSTDKKSIMAMEEMAIFIETDALQFEMGNIVPVLTVSGNVQYNTHSPNLHKDRYTSVGMALEYILQLEEKIKEGRRNEGDFCMGAAYVL